ncbi:MAG: adaptor protein MecA [Lachnospiraceae bacterium]|nr:adaptor protein MecA [Lachnospiraceae bacterium]
MKIEKLNENQIRCTLNKSDLADHNIRLTELAYGTDRAKALFRDMMQKASDDVGFEVGDIPLMIEAIPVNPDCLILIITKVEDPEELDTRFSKFTKPSGDMYDDYEDDMEDDEDDDFNSATSIFDVLGNIVENLEAVRNASADKSGFQPLSVTAEKATATKKETKKEYDIYRIFVFANLDNVTSAAEQLRGVYDGENTLFKNPKDSHYYLILNRSEHTNDEFNLVCNTLCEFGSKLKTSYAMPYHMAEHFQPIIKRSALQTLGEL